MESCNGHVVTQLDQRYHEAIVFDKLQPRGDIFLPTTLLRKGGSHNCSCLYDLLDEVSCEEYGFSLIDQRSHVAIVSSGLYATRALLWSTKLANLTINAFIRSPL